MGSAKPTVVSYRNSTSNHNNPRYLPNKKKLYLIEILHQTTTSKLADMYARLLYLIEILHQTTTRRLYTFPYFQLYLIEILHQTTTILRSVAMEAELYLIEILHQTTTPIIECSPNMSLYLIEILHQTTTSGGQQHESLCCILSKFYIKPQPRAAGWCYRIVVSYRNSTSNHNNPPFFLFGR